MQRSISEPLFAWWGTALMCFSFISFIRFYLLAVGNVFYCLVRSQWRYFSFFRFQYLNLMLADDLNISASMFYKFLLFWKWFLDLTRWKLFDSQAFIFVSVVSVWLLIVQIMDWWTDWLVGVLWIFKDISCFWQVFIYSEQSMHIYK